MRLKEKDIKIIATFLSPFYGSLRLVSDAEVPEGDEEVKTVSLLQEYHNTTEQ